MANEQSLFGIKAQLQFGKLFVTGVIASQRSQSQSTTLQGGASLTTYQFKADDYDENRHFLLAQFFRNNYNKAMSNLPIITSAGADPAYGSLGNQPQRNFYSGQTGCGADGSR